MDMRTRLILRENYDDDINPLEECAIESNNFSLKAIPLIIKDDLDGFIELVSSPEFNYDGNFPHARERMYLSDYLYQPFFDELTGPNALCFAAFFNAEKIVEFILGLPDVDKTDAFHFACAGGSFNVMRTLFEQSECDLINKDQVRPLNIASYFGNVDVVKYLFSHGCPIISPQDRYSSINKAAFNGNINVLEFFKEVDPNLLKKMKDYKHPIISAAIGGQPKCINYFLKLGDLDKSTISSALKEAIKKGSLSCVKILLSAYKENALSKKKKIVKSQKKTKKRIKIDEDFVPNKQKGRRNKRKKEDEDSDEEEEDLSDGENEEEEKGPENSLPISFYMLAVQMLHIDILRYLFQLYIPESLDELLLCAIDQINFNKLLYSISPNEYYSSMPKPSKENNEQIFNEWKQKSLPAVKIAEFIISNSKKKKDFFNVFFDSISKSNSVNNIIYFLDQINFKINNEDELNETQLDFFRTAILCANSITIPYLKRILNDKDIDFFESKKFEELLSKSDFEPGIDQKMKKKKQDESREESILMNTFEKYLKTLSSCKYIKLTAECALFLIEKKFPYEVMLKKKIKHTSSYRFASMMLPFFEANIKLNNFDTAKKILNFIPPHQFHIILYIVIKKAKEIFNNNEDTKKRYTFNAHIDLNYITSFNKKMLDESTKEAIPEIKFNLFEYQCQNEEEMAIYQQIMELIKICIKISSTNPQSAILLCENGLNKKWIIEQMKENNENEIIEANELSRACSNNIFNDFKNNSINPLIKIAFLIGTRSFQYNQNSFLCEISRYYMNYGIDVSQGTEYTKMLWKYVIDQQKGSYANILIHYGNADKEELLLDDSITLIDYAIQVKAVNICYIFFSNDFYSQNSNVIQNPSEVIDSLSKEKLRDEEKKNNLKIIALIFHFLEFSYDQRKKNKLLSDLQNRMKPLSSNQYSFFL